MCRLSQAANPLSLASIMTLVPQALWIMSCHPQLQRRMATYPKCRVERLPARSSSSTLPHTPQLLLNSSHFFIQTLIPLRYFPVLSFYVQLKNKNYLSYFISLIIPFPFLHHMQLKKSEFNLNLDRLWRINITLCLILYEFFLEMVY